MANPGSFDDLSSFEGSQTNQSFPTRQGGKPFSFADTDNQGLVFDPKGLDNERDPPINGREDYPGEVTSYGQQLRYERKLRGLTEEQLA